ncbi:amidohydrolase [Salicibibacter halophilus]|uniref:Amidohydrolase n=1 Tax=Salicibibacter halophilus TaxID=2502791 RepID=A0A514LLR3_9BACI|nr:amidohydrolase [Salicibibacter halophilus]QDI92804.1 amidohydrolase [Salicibibacter halophilus]
MEEQLYQTLTDYYQEMVDIRRHLHQYPEVSFEEIETPNYIARYHEALGIPVKTGVGGRGVVATLKGGKPGPTIALRADFDALPIQDQKNVPYKSKIDGAMHGCGHDGHTAILLVLAKALAEQAENLKGTIVFLHQHAEEHAPGGAEPMIADGCLEGVDVVFGTHLWSVDPLWTIQQRNGPFMAATDQFYVNIEGMSGHGAAPHTGRDAIVIGSQMVNTIQTLVSRRVNPLESAVVSIGSFVADNPYNVIAGTASLVGTVRTFKEDVRTQMEQELDDIVTGTAKTMGATADFKYERGYAPVINDEVTNNYLASIAETVPGVERVDTREPIMAAEDFSAYLKERKGTFFFTGAAFPDREENYPHHHPKFDFDERAMLIAAKTLGKAVLAYN